MKKLITFVSLLFFASLVVSQTTTDEYYSLAKKKLFSADRVVTSLSMVTSVNFFNTTKATGISTFIAPQIGYQLTDKFQLNIGLMLYTLIGNTFIPINNSELLYGRTNKNVSGNVVFVEGQYKLNKRVSMTGSVMMDVNSFNNKQNNYKAISLGLNYKVSEHAYIGFSGTLSQGNSQNYFFDSKTNSFEYIPSNSKYGTVFSSLANGLGEWGVKSLNSMTK